MYQHPYYSRVQEEPFVSKRTLGESIRLVRERRGLSVSQLAARAGMGQPAVSLIENGNRPNPGADTLIRIARALRVSLDELVGNEPTKSLQPLEAALSVGEQIADLDLGLAQTNKALGDLALRVQANSVAIESIQSVLEKRTPAQKRRR
jgi:transcriptional regulator with XRE-family HTH domain